MNEYIFGLHLNRFRETYGWTFQLSPIVCGLSAGSSSFLVPFVTKFREYEVWFKTLTGLKRYETYSKPFSVAELYFSEQVTYRVIAKIENEKNWNWFSFESF